MAKLLILLLRPALGPHSRHLCRQFAACFIGTAIVLLVDTSMLTSGHDRKILWPVVVSDPIDVVDMLGVSQESSNGVFHHNAMLQNVTTHRSLAPTRGGVIWAKHVDVAMFVPASAGELRVFQAGQFRFVPANVRLRIAKVPTKRNDSLDSNLGTAAATTTAVSVPSLVGRRKDPTALLGGQEFLSTTSKLMTCDESTQRPAPRLAFKGYAATAFANRHVVIVPRLEGRAA